MRSRLLAISDRRRLPGGDLVAWACRLAASGVEALQIREKDLTDRELYELARRVREVFSGRLLVNGRPDIAVAVQADGVHLPALGLPVAAVRKRFHRPFLVGFSAHSPEEVAAALRAGADYVTLSPIFRPSSKPSHGPPLGLETLREAVAVGIPIFALGGLTADRLEAVAAAGAAGAAGIALFLEPRRLSRVTGVARRAFTGSPGER